MIEPAWQLSQYDWPGVFWNLPASHAAHSVCPADAWYSPAAHVPHASAADVVEYLPVLHSLQELAPPLMPVFVTEPASHCSHDVLPAAPAYLPASQSVQASTDDAEYLPATHAVHVVAPAVEPVFVTEPASHSMHEATLDAVE